MSRIVPSDEQVNSPPDFYAYQGQPEFIFRGTHYQFKCKLGKGKFGDTSLFGARPESTASGFVARPFVVVKSELPYISGENVYFREGVTFEIEARWNKTLYGLGELSGHPRANRQHHLLMPYFPGKSLKHCLADHRESFDARTMLQWFITVALSFKQIVHNRCAVHGDVKPSNIMIQSSDHGIESHPVDFGLTAQEGELIGHYEGNLDDCSQLPAELFRAYRVAAEKNQDSFGLGYVLMQMASLLLVRTTPREDRINIQELVNGLRESIPSQRLTIDQVVARTNTSFFSPIPHPMRSLLISPRMVTQQKSEQLPPLRPAKQQNHLVPRVYRVWEERLEAQREKQRLELKELREEIRRLENNIHHPIFRF